MFPSCGRLCCSLRRNEKSSASRTFPWQPASSASAATRLPLSVTATLPPHRFLRILAVISRIYLVQSLLSIFPSREGPHGSLFTVALSVSTWNKARHAVGIQWDTRRTGKGVRGVVTPRGAVVTRSRSPRKQDSRRLRSALLGEGASGVRGLAVDPHQALPILALLASKELGTRPLLSRHRQDQRYGFAL